MTRGRGQPPHDLLGQRFGRLLVVGLAPTVRYSRWRCRCDCGGTIVVPLNLLRMGERGGTRSCGCLRREQAAANLRRMHAEQRLPQYRSERQPVPCALQEVWR